MRTWLFPLGDVKFTHRGGLVRSASEPVRQTFGGDDGVEGGCVVWVEVGEECGWECGVGDVVVVDVVGEVFG